MKKGERPVKKLITLAAAGALLGAAGSVEGRGLQAYGAAKASQDGETIPGQQALINVNNMSMWFKRDGLSGRNPLTDNSGVTFPRSTGAVIFQDGLVWGGIVRDGGQQELRVGGQTYEIGTVPGRILSRGVAEDPGDPGVRIYRIRRDFRTADLRLDASESLGIGLSAVTDGDVEELRAQYERDWREWPWEKGAPYYDNDGDGSYDPDADEPGVAGADQVAWFVVNDLDEGATQALYGSNPIGLEAQMLFWAYARTDALGDVIFKKYTVIYKGTSTTPDTARVEDMYFAQWSDPDLGDYGDDFAGADVGLSLGYVYNSTDHDHTYDRFGLAPPAVGYDFLQGPVVPAFLEDDNGDTVLDEEGEPVLDETSEAIFNFGLRPGFRNLPMTSFVYFAAGSPIGDPGPFGSYEGTQEWYNLLRGFQPQPDIDKPVPYTNPLTGDDTFFTLDGDPTTSRGWNDGVPLPSGDRRIVLNTGPFEMALGDTQEVVVALLGGISTDRLRSVSKLKFADEFAQRAYNRFPNIPSPPASPDVWVTELDQMVLLDWGWNEAVVEQTEGDDGSEFVFEGYNLYQLPSAEATLDQGERLSTFDLENGVRSILGRDFDDRSGLALDVPLQVGSDFGVRRIMRLTRDALRGGPLVNGQEYYFAVTAYNYNASEDAAETTLESSPQTLICVPRMPPLGTRYQKAIRVDHAEGSSDGSVAVTVVDPTRATGEYQVEFVEEVDETTGETATAWQLRNTTRNEILVEPETDQSGAGLYVPSEYFEIQVSEAPWGMKDWEIPAGARWLTWDGAKWGAEGFNGAVTGDPNHYWFSPTTVTQDRLRTVELRFTSVEEADGENQYKPLDLANENVSRAYRYLRAAGAAPPAPDDLTSTSNGWDFSPYIINTEGPGVYVYQDRVPIALSAWDVQSEPPRRLEVAFLENNLPGGLVNGAYGPAFSETTSNVAGGGPREWLFIFDLEYTDPDQGQNSDILLRNGLIRNAASEENLPFMWIIFAARDQEDRFPQDGDSFRLIANQVNTPEDIFRFEVAGALFDPELQKEDVARINVFPNPYYGVNEAETSPYNHFVTFSHLPQRATVRLYDLAGNLVRTLEKEDPDPYLRWDLDNHNGLPVASGIYLAHVELPDVGRNRVLRVVILQEQQFLESY